MAEAVMGEVVVEVEAVEAVMGKVVVVVSRYTKSRPGLGPISLVEVKWMYFGIHHTMKWLRWCR